jgi:predicted nucleic acid-binding protein
VTLVIDTNILVSALLHPGRTPDRCLAALLAGGVRVAVSEAVEAEYREVLGRPKFRAVEPARRQGLLDALLGPALRVHPVPASAVLLTDEGDRPFIDLCLAVPDGAVVTGNPRHFPAGLGFEVLSAATLLARLPG